MNNQEITHKDESGKESFKFTQRGYMWLNPETLKWNYCNPAFSLRSLSDIKRIVVLEKQLCSLVRGIKDLGSISYDQFPDTKTAENILKEPKP
jgi:hypothetical protein